MKRIAAIQRIGPVRGATAPRRRHRVRVGAYLTDLRKRRPGPIAWRRGVLLSALVGLALVGPVAAQLRGTEASGHDAERARVAASLDRLPLAFIENQGQWEAKTRFIAHRGALTARLEPGGLVLRLQGRGEVGARTIRGAVVRLAFEGSSKRARLVGEKRGAGRYNFFLGHDRDRWRTGVSSYGSVLYRGLYDGIDVRLREGEGRVLEYDVLVEPGAGLKPFIVRCEGADGLRLTDEGSLVIETVAGDLRMKPPTSWETTVEGERLPIVCRYRLMGDRRFTIDAPGRRPGRALVVDPGLVYSTFLGGAKDDYINGLAIDARGAITVVGTTDSADFPTTPGAFDRSFNLWDGFVVRLAPDGASLDYATYLGGTQLDNAYAVSVDAQGAATVVGDTLSTDFPTTPGAFDRVRGSGGNPTDAFVARLSPSGGSLVFSTFLGGTGIDRARAVAVDAQGRTTVTGDTDAADFPVTKGAFDTTHNGNKDAFVAQLSSTGASLVYSTFVGGTGLDRAMAIALDAKGAASVAGETYSRDFPATSGAFDTTFNGGNDGFIARLSPSGATLIYSTYLGGTNLDFLTALALDAQGAVTVAGMTRSADFPITSGAFDPTHNGGLEDAVIARLSPSGASLVYSTFLGGTKDEYAAAIALDTQGAATVTGGTQSVDFPTTPGAFNRKHSGSRDAFVARLSSSGGRLLYSTFLGAPSGAGPVALDPENAATVAGTARTSGFPVTPGAYDRTYNGGPTDGFVVKLAITCIQAGGTTRPGGTVTLDLFAPGDSGLTYQVGSSFGTGPIRIGNRRIRLSPDPLLDVSVSGYQPGTFDGYRGQIDAQDRGKARLHIPNHRLLVGLRIHTAFITVSPSAPFFVKSISDTFSFPITN